LKKAINENTTILESAREVSISLKPTEDGLNDIIKLPPPLEIGKNLDLIPGRLST
jgi:hypothetical protein